MLIDLVNHMDELVDDFRTLTDMENTALSEDAELCLQEIEHCVKKMQDYVNELNLISNINSKGI